MRNKNDLPVILFDFDGTLHIENDAEGNQYDHYIATINRFCKADKDEIKNIINSEKKRFKQIHGNEFHEKLIQYIISTKTINIPSIEDIHTVYIEEKSLCNPFNPTISKEDFHLLRSKYKIGIITNSSTFHEIRLKQMKDAGFDVDYFVNCTGDLQKKPDKSMYNEMLRKYDLGKENILCYVGNEGKDREFAKECDMNFVEVQNNAIKVREFMLQLDSIKGKARSML